ncbi:MAG: metallophosphoesterase [Lentisphaerae bacterium]|nr:metallophosphoesterase [Lentisphaerota bacterium]
MDSLKVAIISDSQAYPSLNDWGMGRVKKAFELLAPMKPDLVLAAGDLADGTNYETFRFYRKLYDEYFPGVPMLACAGNHDYWAPAGMKRDPEEIYRNFCEIFGQRNEAVWCEVVGGIPFISVSEDIADNRYSAEVLEKLESAVRKAVSEYENKPVFVMTHYPPAGTMVGSGDSLTRGGMREIFDRYPQVISLSGHTHWPLEDERSIWQGNFTAFQTSTLSYGCMSDYSFYNACGGVIIPFAREVGQVMFMEISDQEVVIRRFNVEDKREIKPHAPWRIGLPYTPAKAVYTAKRRETSPAPQFPAGAMAYFRYDFGYLYLVCDPAEHPDLVHHYRVRVIECGKEEKLLADERYVAMFYRLKSFADGKEVFRLPGEVIRPASRCRFEIIPVESFGNEGRALTFEFDIPSASGFKCGRPDCPQE